LRGALILSTSPKIRRRGLSWHVICPSHGFVTTCLCESHADTLHVWEREPENAHDAIDSTSKQIFEGCVSVEWLVVSTPLKDAVGRSMQ
jgi:hypothetical protein